MTTLDQPGSGCLRVIHIWGTVITVDVRDAVAPEAIDGVVSWFERVDEIFSTWRDDSEVSRLARGAQSSSGTAPVATNPAARPATVPSIQLGNALFVPVESVLSGISPQGPATTRCVPSPPSTAIAATPAARSVSDRSTQCRPKCTT